MGKGVSAALVGVLCWVVLMAALPQPEETVEKPRLYSDPKGRFSFQLLGDWVKLPGDAEKEIVGSFLLTKEVGGKRKVAAELLISFAELKAPISLEEYVKAEDRRAMNTPGFARVGKQEGLTLGGHAAVRNRYIFSERTGSQELRYKLLDQYYVLKDDAIWGLTLSTMRQDEPVLSEIERVVLSSFQFSVPEGSRDDSLEVFEKVTVSGSPGGFSLSVPGTWEVSQSEEQGVSIRGPEAVVYAFAVPGEKKAESPQDLAGRFLKERENLKELRVLSQGEGELVLVKRYAVEYLGTARGRSWHVRLVAFISGERVFFLHCLAPEEGWSGNSEILRRIERSFSVATPAAKVEESECASPSL